MALFVATGLDYNEALYLIKSLKEIGIESNITTGGVSIQLTSDRINDAKEMCEIFKAEFKPGYSEKEKDSLIKNGEFENVFKVTRDAESLIQEWK